MSNTYFSKTILLVLFLTVITSCNSSINSKLERQNLELLKYNYDLLESRFSSFYTSFRKDYMFDYIDSNSTRRQFYLNKIRVCDSVYNGIDNALTSKNYVIELPIVLENLQLFGYFQNQELLQVEYENDSIRWLQYAIIAEKAKLSYLLNYSKNRFHGCEIQSTIGFYSNTNGLKNDFVFGDFRLIVGPNILLSEILREGEMVEVDFEIEQEKGVKTLTFKPEVPGNYTWSGFYIAQEQDGYNDSIRISGKFSY